jgi:hypothetical protein
MTQRRDLFGVSFSFSANKLTRGDSGGLTGHPNLRPHTPDRRRGMKRRRSLGASFCALSPGIRGSNLDPPVTFGLFFGRDEKVSNRLRDLGIRGSEAQTFTSYRPTRWSAEMDRAVVRSNETAVAMTAGAQAQP